MITVHLQITNHRKLTKTWVYIAPRPVQTKNSNQVSVPVAGEHGSFLYAIY